MKKLKRNLVRISFLTSTLVCTTVKAEVVDPMDLKFTPSCIVKDGLVVEDWVLIREESLRYLNKDSHDLETCEITLNSFAGDTKSLRDDIEFCNRELALQDDEVEKLTFKLEESVKIPWYRNHVYWGTAGFLVGVLVAGSIARAAR